MTLWLTVSLSQWPTITKAHYQPCGLGLVSRSSMGLELGLIVGLCRLNLLNRSVDPRPSVYHTHLHHRHRHDFGLSSCFGISSSVFSWIKSYILNRSFFVDIENSKSCVFQLYYGVPQGSVLGSLLFILYTTPFSTVISNSAANHHLYADDTQLLLSFSALDFSHNITRLENTITYPTGCFLISCLLILLKLSSHLWSTTTPL